MTLVDDGVADEPVPGCLSEPGAVRLKRVCSDNPGFHGVLAVRSGESGGLPQPSFSSL